MGGCKTSKKSQINQSGGSVYYRTGPDYNLSLLIVYQSAEIESVVLCAVDERFGCRGLTHCCYRVVRIDDGPPNPCAVYTPFDHDEGNFGELWEIVALNVYASPDSDSNQLDVFIRGGGGVPSSKMKQKNATRCVSVGI